jgi:hypothetical protein
MKYLILIFVQIAFIFTAQAKEDCKLCDQLKIIETQLRAKNKPEDYYNSLQLKATGVIAKMTAGDKLNLSPGQVARFAQVIRLSVANDKSESIIDSNVPVISANEVELKKEFAKFPKNEAAQLVEAIDTAIGHIEKGPDPSAPDAD